MKEQERGPEEGQRRPKEEARGREKRPKEKPLAQAQLRRQGQRGPGGEPVHEAGRTPESWRPRQRPEEKGPQPVRRGPRGQERRLTGEANSQ